MNEKLKKLSNLSFFEWKILLISLFMLPVIALLLWGPGYNRTIALSNKFISKNKFNQNSKEKLEQQAHTIAYALSVAAKYGPYRANCLKQSVLLWWLLARRGIPAEIKFGVRKDSIEELEAHAWVEYEGINLLDSEFIQEQTAAFTKSNT